MAELGRGALAIALGLEVWAVCAGGYAAFRGRRRLAASAQNALYAPLGAIVVAAAAPAAALPRRDFSFSYVAEHTSRKLTNGYAAASFWSGQEGSLLLWLLILATFSAAGLFLPPPPPPRLPPRARPL